MAPRTASKSPAPLRSSRVRPPILPRERARQKLEQGVPLLHDEDLDFDPAGCFVRFDQLLGHGRSGEDVRRALASGRLDLTRALEEALVDHHDHLAELAEWAGLPLGTLAPPLTESVLPSLRELAVVLRPLLAWPRLWHRGYCPLCGAWPAYGVSGEAGTERCLRCARCGSQWASPPERCIFCGSAGSRPQAPDELVAGGARVVGCEHCRRYLVVVKAAEAGAEIDWSVVEHLAHAHGLRPPAGAGFRLELADEAGGESNDDLLELD